MLMVDTKIIGVGVVIALVISFIGGTQLSEKQIDKLWYCEVENVVRECTALSKYGVADAKCTYLTDEGMSKGDICTAGGIRYAWKPASEYVSLLQPAKVLIQSLQECKIVQYDVSEKYETTCENTVINRSICLKTVKLFNGTNCVEYGTSTYTYPCKMKRTVQKEKIECEPKGFNVTIAEKKYQILGRCCGAFNTSTGYRIECKERINDICNPKCQQTSIDPNEYDEYCLLYYISETGIKRELVGEYDYVLDNQVELSTLKEAKT